MLTAPPQATVPPVPLVPLVIEVEATAGALKQTDGETLLDTPPEELLAAASPASAVEENIADPAPAPLPGEEEGLGERARLPAWAWWAGAITVVLMLAFGIRALFGGGSGDEMPEPTEESGGAIAAVIPTTTATPTAVPPTSTATTMPEPTNTATAVPSPTATLDPNVPPPDAELGSLWERPQDEMKMVYVPPGTFPMGSEEGGSNEQPEHDVMLDGFWVDETEVTNAHYAQCVNTGECAASTFEDDPTFNGEDYPVVGVSWEGADAYCGWAGAQLPTEAQWEYAARGPEGLAYPWGEDFDGEKANYCDENCDRVWKDEEYNDGYGETAPVGSYQEGASWSGALDMAGNVWEWVKDWYDSEYYANTASVNPAGPESGDFKVLRGGSWSIKSLALRGANRLIRVPDGRLDVIGFRCVLPGR